MKKTIISFIAMVIVSGATGLSGLAATSASTLKASSTISSACTIATVNINFGTMQSVSSGETTPGTGSISVHCTKGTSYNISTYSAARHMSGSIAGNNDVIYYSICRAAGFSIAQGCGSYSWYNTSTTMQAGIGTGSTQTYTMYGYATNGYYTPDNYSATDTATITY